MTTSKATATMGETVTVSRDKVVVPYLKIRSTSIVQNEEFKAIFVQNDSGTYLIDAWTVAGGDVFENGAVSLSYPENTGAAFSAAWEETDDGSTLRVIASAEGILGIIPLEITVYGPGATSAVIKAEIYVIPNLTNS